MSGSVLFSQTTLVVVENPEKVSLEVIWDHHEEGDEETCLVLHHQGKIRGNTKFGKLIKKLPKGRHLEFLEVAGHKAKDAALQFCMAESKRLGHPMNSTLAGVLVNAIGTDFGVLAFEILKAATYTDALGEDGPIESRHVRLTVSSKFAPKGLTDRCDCRLVDSSAVPTRTGVGSDRPLGGSRRFK